jgi:hypothetical protein
LRLTTFVSTLTCVILSVYTRPSALNNSAHTGTIFVKFYIWVFFEKYVAKFQVSLKSDKNNGYFTWRPIYIMITCRLILLRMRNVSENSCRENQITHFIFNNVFRKTCHLRGNVKKCCRPGEAADDNITRSMRFACQVTKATDTHSECVIFIVLSRQQYLRECASMSRYTNIARLFHI